jgi:hypothetical protein
MGLLLFGLAWGCCFSDQRGVVAFPISVALLLFGLAWGFSPTKSSRRKALPLCRRPERSPKGEATRSIAFAFVVAFAFPEPHPKINLKTEEKFRAQKRGA